MPDRNQPLRPLCGDSQAAIDIVNMLGLTNAVELTFHMTPDGPATLTVVHEMTEAEGVMLFTYLTKSYHLVENEPDDATTADPS